MKEMLAQVRDEPEEVLVGEHKNYIYPDDYTFMWVRGSGIWCPSNITAQVIDSGVLKHLMANPNEQVKLRIVFKQKLTEAEFDLSLRELIAKYPRPIGA